MERVWRAISTNKSGEGSKEDLWPLLTKYSDKDSWLQLLRPILPANLDQDLFIKVLRDDEQVMQSVMWTKVNYPDEVHDDLQECFMILEGECECYVDEQVIILGPGDFFDVPLHAHHDVKIITAQVLAVVQRRRIA